RNLRARTHTPFANILGHPREAGVSTSRVCDVRAHIIFEDLSLLLDISREELAQDQLRVGEAAVVRIRSPAAGYTQVEAVDAHPEPMVAVYPLPEVQRLVGEHGPEVLSHRLRRVGGFETAI